MDISAIETKLNGLLNEINSIPASPANKLMLLTAKAKPIGISNTETLDQSLDHLRLVIKYMLFDVEATRRENKYLRKMLEGQQD
jgi:hypothetical protein